MIIIKSMEEFKNIENSNLVHYLKDKYINLMQEYGCSMAEIGEIHIYQSDIEFLNNGFNQSTYELMEVIEVSNLDYLHLVQLVDDYYCVDIYVSIKRKEVI